MTIFNSITPECTPSPTSRERQQELLRALLLLIEASLKGSRKALLALDLAGIESGTSDQVGLLREFDALLERRRAWVAVGSAEPPAPGSKVRPPEPEEELQRSQNRISDALRLQAALLVRARSKLRILANMLAGPTVSYGPLMAQAGGLARLTWQREERSDSCPA